MYFGHYLLPPKCQVLVSTLTVLSVCMLVCCLFFWRDPYLEVRNLTNLREMEYRGVERVFFTMGKMLRVQIPKRRANDMLKKVKSAQMLTCRHLHICHVFPPQKKTRQMSRQTCSRFGFLGQPFKKKMCVCVCD